MPQHVIQRGNNRQATVFAEEDYRFYLECLADAARKYGCQIYAYVLMTNPVQLRAYRDHFSSELDWSELGVLRDTVNRGWPLGSERFKDEIERALACAVRPPKRGRRTRSIMLQGKPFG